MSYLCGATKWMPLILCIATPLSIFLTYGIAVAKGHVAPLFPYISDTGTTPPESCVFGLLLGSIAFLLSVIIYIRYREISEYAKQNPSIRITPFWNRLSAFLGFVSAFGLHMVANFQETNEFITHIVGAMMCFYSATLYFFLQTIFTRIIHPKAKFMFWIRIILSCLCVLFIAGTFAPISAAMKAFKGAVGCPVSLTRKFPYGHDDDNDYDDDDDDNVGKNILLWSEKDGGFTYHLISTFSEWFLVFSFCGYISTIVWDFRKLQIEPPRIKILSLEGEGLGGGRNGEEEIERGRERNDGGPNKSPWV